ncbi:hypothetical protein F5J12DRAFT_817791 [Pisolithus orientalis]|uniref:uncharacterized protein n=1 Tax=Pisolithus orientalis TaxID=936130 RepID=UPI002225043F|nr:uncharacterized protein F5J12DRAFT_817791 [Pisolithus orientalis]KAI6015370.1 hypothetical protein F5J12DRAFT_817791 [Pisolithus orientalis]
MANLIRLPKSGSDWTTYDLMAYNITVKTQSFREFFLRNSEASLANLDPSLVNSTIGAESGLPDRTVRYLSRLDWATYGGQECFMDDFYYETLLLLGFEERNAIVCGRHIIPLTICGDHRQTAQMDACLLNRQSMVLLVLQGDKTMFGSTHPEPQVIAKAIAAYQYNNEQRQTRELPLLDAMTIPCITMDGTRPTFYLVPVTEALSNAVVTGQYPKAPTEVVKCVTSLRHNYQSDGGMETPAYRQLAFRRFLAFKDLAKGYSQTYIF